MEPPGSLRNRVTDIAAKADGDHEIVGSGLGHEKWLPFMTMKVSQTNVAQRACSQPQEKLGSTAAILTMIIFNNGNCPRLIKQRDVAVVTSLGEHDQERASVEPLGYLTLEILMKNAQLSMPAVPIA